jgi:trans-2,3-dihydro-3-hydroxyanthranilate isomerase
MATDKRTGLRTLKVCQADAFTRVPFGGNPAGVVTDASDLTDEEMRRIAREINCSETAFVTPAVDATADFRLRWFTPTTEVALCGHATVAAYFCLAAEGRVALHQPVTELHHQTNRGILPAWLHSQSGYLQRVMMSVGRPRFHPADVDLTILAGILRMDARELDADFPLARDDSPRLIVPLRKISTLLSLRPQFRELAQYGRSLGLERFTLFSLETLDPDNRVHLRHFAPGIGIVEDPVTGTAQGAVGAYLAEFGLWGRRDGVITYTGEQGHAVDRPGCVFVEVTLTDGNVENVSVGGEAVIVFRGTLYLPSGRAAGQ